MLLKSALSSVAQAGGFSWLWPYELFLFCVKLTCCAQAAGAETETAKAKFQNSRMKRRKREAVEDEPQVGWCRGFRPPSARATAAALGANISDARRKLLSPAMCEPLSPPTHQDDWLAQYNEQAEVNLLLPVCPSSDDSHPPEFHAVEARLDPPEA